MAREDADALHLVLRDPVAMRFYPRPFSLEMTTEWNRDSSFDAILCAVD